MFRNFSAGVARDRFERVLALDDTFGEAHGGIALLDLMDGHIEDVRRRTDVALRLDRQSLGGALTQSLLLKRAGDAAGASRKKRRSKLGSGFLSPIEFI